MVDFHRNPRNYALQLVEDGIISQDTLINILINSMSFDDVREALDNNELSPRFFEDYSEDEEDGYTDLEFDNFEYCSIDDTDGFILSDN